MFYVCRYYHACGVDATMWESELMNYIFTNSDGRTDGSLTIQELSQCPTPIGMQHQLIFVSSLPNNHWWSFPKTGKLTGMSCPDGKVKLLQQLAYQSPQLSEDMTILQPHNLPLSPRNRLIYFSCFEQQQRVKELVTHLLGPSVENIPDTEYVPHMARYKPQVVRFTEERLLRNIGASNMATQQSCYHDFEQSLFSDQGVLAWRYHTPELDILIMNDYSSKDGIFIPASYVHLNVHHYGEDQEDIMVCSCDVYKLLQSSDLYCDAVDSHGVTCMHVRLYRDRIKPVCSQLFAVSPHSFVSVPRKLQESLQFLNLGNYYYGNESLLF